MDKKILYVYSNDNTKLYFLYDEASNKWIGGRQNYDDEDAYLADFVAIAKLFGTELINQDVDDEYTIDYITKGQPIYNYRRNEVMYVPVIPNANNLIEKDHNPVLIREDTATIHKSGIPYIKAPLEYIDNDFVRAFIFDNNFIKFEIEYNINTGEARNARRVH